MCSKGVPAGTQGQVKEGSQEGMVLGSTGDIGRGEGRQQLVICSTDSEETQGLGLRD